VCIRSGSSRASGVALGAVLLLNLLATSCSLSPGSGAAAPRPAARSRDTALGAVAGKLTVVNGASDAADLGAAVVYLDRGPAGWRLLWPGRPPLVFDGAGSISPAVVGGTVGQTLRLAFEGGVLHRPFTFTEGGVRVDLPTTGDGGTLRLAEPGVLRIYCSLHRSERSIVYAVRSPFVAPVDRRGQYGIVDVPPGAYRLVLWSEGVSGPIRSIEIESGSRLDAPIWIDARQVRR